MFIDHEWRQTNERGTVETGQYGFFLAMGMFAVAILFLQRAPCLAQAPEIEMVRVTGGCFQMGDTFGDGRDDEKPIHEVCVSDFYIGRYEVTQVQWQAVMGNNPSSFKGDRRPVDSVSWEDAEAFIAKLNRMTGRRYRLPTEAEWEYAARSGGRKEKWAGTSDKSQLGDYAWDGDNSGEETHVVGTKRPNELGLYDMSGNVREWVEDRYGDVWYEESPRDNPRGPQKGSARVLRGGSWRGDPWGARAAYRGWYDPAIRNNYFGFRLASSAR
jgi:formylglycine-generating enzyme required for sulfatase activity